MLGDQKYQLKESLDVLKNKIGNLKIELREEMLRADNKTEVGARKEVTGWITVLPFFVIVFSELIIGLSKLITVLLKPAIVVLELVIVFTNW